MSSEDEEQFFEEMAAEEEQMDVGQILRFGYTFMLGFVSLL